MRLRPLLRGLCSLEASSGERDASDISRLDDEITAARTASTARYGGTAILGWSEQIPL